MDVQFIAPTSSQINFLKKLGCVDFTGDRSGASDEISRLLAMQEKKKPEASDAQRRKLAAVGGKDLPGASIREASTAIAILELLANIGDVELAGGEGDYEVAAVNQLLAYLRERFVK